MTVSDDSACKSGQNGHDGHDPCDGEDAGEEGEEPAAPEQVLLGVAAVFHDTGDGRGRHRGHEGRERTGFNQDHQTAGVAAELMAGGDGNREKDQHRAAIGHELSKHEGEKEEDQTDQIIIADLNGQPGDETADQAARTGAGEGCRHRQRADNEKKHAQGDRFSGFFRFQDAAAYHENRTDETDLPDLDGTENAVPEHEDEGRAEEDDDTGSFGEEGQGRLFSALTGFGFTASGGEPVRGETGHDKSAVDNGKDQQGKARLHGIEKVNHRHGAGEAFQRIVVHTDVAAELRRLGGAGADGQGAAGEDRHNAEGEHKPGPRKAHGFGRGHTEGSRDTEDDDGALDHLAQEHGENAVKQHHHGGPAFGEARNSGGQAGAEAGSAEARGNHAHRPDHDNGSVREAGKHCLRGETAGQGEGRDGRHGDGGQTPYAGHIADAGQGEDDQADDDLC